MTASRTAALAVVLSFGAASARAETGYDLWLRYAAVTDSAQLRTYRQQAATLVCGGGSATARATRAELQRGLKGLLGRDVALAATVTAGGAVVSGRPPARRSWPRSAGASGWPGSGRRVSSSAARASRDIRPR